MNGWIMTLSPAHEVASDLLHGSRDVSRNVSFREAEKSGRRSGRDQLHRKRAFHLAIEVREHRARGVHALGELANGAGRRRARQAKLENGALPAQCGKRREIARLSVPIR